MKKFIFFAILIFALQAPLASAQDESRYGNASAPGTFKTVIVNSNKRTDLDCTVVFHKINNPGSGPSYLCYILDQNGRNIRTIR